MESLLSFSAVIFYRWFIHGDRVVVERWTEISHIGRRIKLAARRGSSRSESDSEIFKTRTADSENLSGVTLERFVGALGSCVSTVSVKVSGLRCKLRRVDARNYLLNYVPGGDGA